MTKRSLYRSSTLIVIRSQYVKEVEIFCGRDEHRHSGVEVKGLKKLEKLFVAFVL